MKSNLRILEISIPHASAEGTLNAALKVPKQLSSDAFNTVFVLPWFSVNTALSESPYAVTDYMALNKAIGSMDDARNWIEQCHQCGLRVVLDMPLNHTSPRHKWMANPGWYLTDKDGTILSPQGTQWYDVAQLNHHNAAVVTACEEALGFWLGMGVDGFRFDAASFIPDDVLNRWVTCAKNAVTRELLLWCDGEVYRQNRPFFNGFLYHEAFCVAKTDHERWVELISSAPDEAIFYLSNHDSLHAGKSPLEEWHGSYQYMRDRLEAASKNHVLSWSDWQNPASRYSFMLRK